MPLLVTPEDGEFLRDVVRLEALGKSQREIAALLGVAPGTITYRLNRLGYGSESRIVDRRTGRTLAEDLNSGEIVVAAEVEETSEKVA